MTSHHLSLLKLKVYMYICTHHTLFTLISIDWNSVGGFKKVIWTRLMQVDSIQSCHTATNDKESFDGIVISIHDLVVHVPFV